MKLDFFEQMDARELRSYIEFYLCHYRARVAFGGFTNPMERVGQRRFQSEATL
jgi:hypothetical protein